MRSGHWLAVAVTIMALAPTSAAEPGTNFRPDPVSVQRFGSGYRYPQAGWIVLHIEGEPYRARLPARPAAGAGDRRLRPLLRRPI